MIVRWIKKTVAWLVVIAVLVIGVWTWGALSYVYSRGERAGYVQKFSKRGWLFKTWEGELAMVNLPGAMPEKFPFSVRSDAVAKEVEKTMGNRVVLSYEQHRFLPLPIFAQTEYFVINARPVEAAAAPAPLPISGQLK